MELGRDGRGVGVGVGVVMESDGEMKGISAGMAPFVALIDMFGLRVLCVCKSSG